MNEDRVISVVVDSVDSNWVRYTWDTAKAFCHRSNFPIVVHVGGQYDITIRGMATIISVVRHEG